MKCYTENELPHTQLPVALGFLKVNPNRLRSSFLSFTAYIRFNNAEQPGSLDINLMTENVK